jgi:aquaporin Z
MTDEILSPGDVLEEAPVEPTTSPTHKLAAEAIGTFLLVLLGVGAAITTGADPTATGLAFGLTLVLGIYAFGRVSGGHFNPAVSVGWAMSGRFSWIEAVRYIVAQVVGAIVAALFLFIVVHGIHGYKISVHGLGQNHYGRGTDVVDVSWWAAFLLELVLTLAFVFVVLAVTDSARNEFAAAAPLAIGLTLAAVYFVAVPLTGASANPARSFGPALFAGGHALGQVWLFILAPALGGALAGLAYPALFGRTEPAVPGSGLVLPEFRRPAPQGPVWHSPASYSDTSPHHPAVPSDTAGTSGPSGTSVPSWQQPVAHDPNGGLPVYEQDGWRWDYAKQQWVPIDQPPAAPPAGPSAGEQTEEITRIVPPAE